MRSLKYLWAALLMLLVVSAPCAHAESSFAAVVQKEASLSSTAVSLCDITGDDAMEMALFSIKSGTLRIFRKNGEILHCTPAILRATGMKVSVRKGGAVAVTVTKKNGSVFYGISVKDGALVQEVSCVTDGKKYSVNGASVTKSVLTAQKNAFLKKYPLGGKIPMLVFTSSADAVKRFPTLESKCLTASRASKVTLNLKSAKIAVGNTTTLKAKTAPATAVWEQVTFSSSDPEVATVTETGTVRALRGGSCVITATARSGAKKTCKVTVPPPPAQSVLPEESEITLAKGEKRTLTFDVLPAGASRSVTWSSSNKKIATVTSAGLVKGIAAGSCVITIKAKSGVKAFVTVNVSAAATAVNISSAKATVTAGKTLTLSAKVLPSTVSQSVTWTSDNDFIATVSAKGVVTAKRAGTAKITASASNGKSASCTVTVKAKGGTYIIDLSQYNTVSDWNKLASCADLIILRATCGTTVDTKFATYASACIQNGIPFGVYCYAKAASITAGEQEAQKLFNTASKYAPLFYVYDVEQSAVKKTIVSAFTAKLRELGVKKVGYYIAHNLYATLKINTSEADFIWIPRYGANTGAPDLKPVYGCDLHQYTSMGSVPGISTRTDLSQLTGTKSLQWFLQ